MKKQFIAPRITKVVNEELMAGVCNDEFVYTSKGGALNGYAKVCYHFRAYNPISSDMYGYRTGANYAYVVNLPANAVFRTDHPDYEGRHFTQGGVYVTEEEMGWRDFVGLNGTCHFIGDIYVNGQLLTKEVLESGNYIVGGGEAIQ